MRTNFLHPDTEQRGVRRGRFLPTSRSHPPPSSLFFLLLLPPLLAGHGVPALPMHRWRFYRSRSCVPRARVCCCGLTDATDAVFRLPRPSIRDSVGMRAGVLPRLGELPVGALRGGRRAVRNVWRVGTLAAVDDVMRTFELLACGRCMEACRSAQKKTPTRGNETENDRLLKMVACQSACATSSESCNSRFVTRSCQVDPSADAAASPCRCMDNYFSCRDACASSE